MASVSTTSCPKCSAALVIEGLSLGQRVLCAGCRAQFFLSAVGPATDGTTIRLAPTATMPAGLSAPRPTPVSGWCNAARVLGFLSLLPLFGLAALAAGLVGLRDIRRHPAKQGTGRAAFGIVAGGITSLGWLMIAIIFSSVYLMSRQNKFVHEPDGVAQMAAEIGLGHLPPDVHPIHGMYVHAIRIKHVTYGSRSEKAVYVPPNSSEVVNAEYKPTVTLVAAQFPRMWASQPQQMEAWLRQQIDSSRIIRHIRFQVEETRQQTYTTRGQPVSVTVKLGRVPETGKPMREYFALFSGDSVPMGVILITGDEPAAEAADAESEFAKANMSEDEVREFFESFGQPADASTATGSTNTSSAVASVSDRKVERLTLENDLTVLLHPVSGTTQAAVVLLYSIGGDHDPEGQCGIAHLMEHLYVTAAAGATPVRTADEFMRKYPAGWNAQTGDRFTVIATVFPKDSLDAELREAAARMGDLRITAADLDREKPRLIDEIQNMFGGHPPLVAYNNSRERIRPTPRGGRKGGLPAHVSAVTPESVQDRWRRFYKPKNATLVVVGAFDPTIVQTMITEHFAKVPAGEPIPPATDPGEPKFSKAIDEVPAKPFQVGAGPELCVAYPAVPRDSELYPAFLVLVGRLSARAQKLDSSSNRFPIDYSALFDPSTLFLTIPIKPGETAEQAVARIDAFLVEAVKSPVGSADRVIAKNRFSFELRTVRQQDSFAAQNLYGFAFTASLRAKLGLDTMDFGKAIDGVTAEQWGQVSQAVLSTNRRVAVVATPK